MHVWLSFKEGLMALLASRSLYRGPNAFRGPGGPGVVWDGEEGMVCVCVCAGGGGQGVNDTDPHFPNSYSIQQ